MALLLFVCLRLQYGRFYRWLEGQELYLMSEQVADFAIPPLTPTLTPTSTPTPLPEARPLPAIRIIIPKIGVNEQIIEIGLKRVGSGDDTRFEWDSAAYAVGHRENSAYPGEQGNIVLSGHNNTQGEVFRDLERLAPGDEIYLYTFDAEFKYVVVAKDIVLVVGAGPEELARHARYVADFPEETLTLVSCWPYLTYTHRIYIVAKPEK